MIIFAISYLHNLHYANFVGFQQDSIKRLITFFIFVRSSNLHLRPHQGNRVNPFSAALVYIVQIDKDMHEPLLCVNLSKRCQVSVLVHFH